MFYVRLDDNGAHRAYRTDRFASAASDAEVGIDLRDRQCPFVWNHVYGLGRAMFCTGAAVFLFCIDDTTAFEESGNADLCRCLLFDSQRLDRTGGSYVGTNRALVITITADIGQTRFQHIIQSVFQPCRA